MKLRDYKAHTFKVCMAWGFNKKSKRALAYLRANLTRWAQSDPQAVPYDYHGDAGMLVHYCADRMNPGSLFLPIFDQS